MKQKNVLCLLLLILIHLSSCASKEIDTAARIKEDKKNTEREQKDLSVSNYRAYYHYSLSRLHFYRREFRQALSEARIAEQIDTNSAPLKYNLAIVLMTLNRFTEALIMLEQSIKLDPDYEPSHKILGRIYASSTDPQRRKEALDKLSKSARYDPKDSETYMFLGIVQSEQKDYQEAIKNFKKFIQLSPRDERGYYFLGRIYFLTDDLQKAEKN
ncbi:MAG: tetratricopeptide repeat protein, partial [Candidatus Dadabacteria bacterium]|nr:tetratricopeptide repeat protein [Candidatus Dadabacteria bacterium]NIT14627.1 tetratricopeptide repeat protein [Candidatus Dadabacteria bacterium]